MVQGQDVRAHRGLVGAHVGDRIVVVVLPEVAGVPFRLLVRALRVVLGVDVHKDLLVFQHLPLQILDR